MPSSSSSATAASLRSFYYVCRKYATAAATVSRSKGRPVPSAAPARASGSRKPTEPQEQISRNEVGVQLLSSDLKSQIFRNVSFPPPEPRFVQIARDHLRSHDLDPSQGSTLPNVSFDLPPLQGDSIDEHFHRLGSSVAEPTLSLSKSFASSTIPPLPETWVQEPGWTKYYPDGSFEHVEDLSDESLICFDVETMPPYHQYAIMACAATPNAWYSWLSPWILGLDDNPSHLIPIGDPSKDRVIVGHNVSYDRSRIAEEYHIERTKNRFLDTMALHVAVKGISSHQRPSWMKHRKAKLENQNIQAETAAVVRSMIKSRKAEAERETDKMKKAAYTKEVEDMTSSLPHLRDVSVDEEDDDIPRWEDITSVNSLAEVAFLYCDVDIDKGPRDDFMKSTPESIRADLDSYLSYCASDVNITHAVYAKVLPLFLETCPSPVTFAGVSTMGNSFLPVNESWELYIESAEKSYRTSEAAVIDALHDLAKQAKDLDHSGQWKDDPWLSQLDWSPKIPDSRRMSSSSSASEPSDDSETPSDVLSEAVEAASPRETAGAEALDANIVDEEVEYRSKTSQYGPRPDGRYAVPKWFHVLVTGNRKNQSDWPHLLDITYRGSPIYWSSQHGYLARLPGDHRLIQIKGTPTLSPDDSLVQNARFSNEEISTPGKYGWILLNGYIRAGGSSRFFTAGARSMIFGRDLSSGQFTRADIIDLTTDDPRFRWQPSHESKRSEELKARKARSVELKEKLIWASTRLFVPRRSVRLSFSNDICDQNRNHPRYSQLDWTPLVFDKAPSYVAKRLRSGSRKIKSDFPLKQTTNQPSAQKLLELALQDKFTWPKWYYDLASPKSGKSEGALDLTPRTKTAALLLKLSWRGFPLFYSREHGWTFRADGDAAKTLKTQQKALSFSRRDDEALRKASEEDGFIFFKLPHKDGETANVGNPLSKTFVQYSTNGTLSSPNDTATKALKMNAECSYWISARDRIMNQMVVWGEAGKQDIGIPLPPDKEDRKWGMILPQVVTMGTVTRRAIEKTWLTASNAKKNRVGSELKAMVRAPPGYAIVGADVDSEELWISSVMGDAQFGLHGASAIGWMTLEGTKSAGTDLHSKTAKILGITRDQAKVFNYSRIYGAGMRHAELLLLQSNPGMSQDQAKRLAENLYASTKGKNTRRKDLFFDRKFWFGGTESFVFNKLEEIALSDSPETPALGCGVTEALSREYLPEGFGNDFMPSRINWVVQSSGVDYLHLLIVAMEHLISTYSIKARYLISVHDELRYLVQEEDKYRLAMALQIANLWTRSQFVYRLGFDDLPQGVAFFSAVDIDHVLRKEVDMTCITPSHPTAIPPGESLDIYKLLKVVPGGSLRPDHSPMGRQILPRRDRVGTLHGFKTHDNLFHRAKAAALLQVQSTKEYAEIKSLSTRYKEEQNNTEDF